MKIIKKKESIVFLWNDEDVSVYNNFHCIKTRVIWSGEIAGKYIYLPNQIIISGEKLDESFTFLKGSIEKYNWDIKIIEE